MIFFFNSQPKVQAEIQASVKKPKKVAKSGEYLIHQSSNLQGIVKALLSLGGLEGM